MFRIFLLNHKKSKNVTKNAGVVGIYMLRGCIPTVLDSGFSISTNHTRRPVDMMGGGYSLKNTKNRTDS